MYRIPGKIAYQMRYILLGVIHMEYILTLFVYFNGDLVRRLEQPVATAAICQQLSHGLNFRDPAVTAFATCRPRS